MRRWGRVGVLLGVVVGVAFGVTVGLQPDGSINLRRAFEMGIFVAGGNGAGSLDGADGIDAADLDGDGKLDLVSGAEQGLRLALAFNPGTDGGAVWEGAWPSVLIPTVNMCSAEDAIFCDVDADGALDVVAACETGTVRVEIMFAPAPPNTRTELLTPANWTRVTLDESADRRSMRAVCADLAGDDSVELLIGGKEANGVAATLGYYTSETPRTGSSWTYTEIDPVSWVMNIHVVDIDDDADLDIVYADKLGISEPVGDSTRRGLRVLKSNGADPPVYTPVQIVNEADHKWHDLVDWDGDGDLDLIDCRSSEALNEAAIWINEGDADTWSKIPVPVPAGVGQCIHGTANDVDLDGAIDLAFTYAQAENLQGLAWQRRSGTALSPSFSPGLISGVLDADSDTKFDNLLWLDVDGDGDKDAISTEQHIAAGTGPGLGMLGFQNPAIAFQPTIAPPAVTCTALASGALAGATTATTASVSPAANAAIYVAYESALAGGPAAPTGVVGNGITYTQVATQAFHTSSTRRLTVLRGMAASPSTGTIVGTWAIAQTSFVYAVIQCTGVDQGGTNASAATVQSVSNTATAATSVTNDLAALAAATSVHLAFNAISINGAQTPDADFVELTDNSTGTGAAGLQSSWATNQTQVTPTFASANAGVVSIEVRIAP